MTLPFVIRDSRDIPIGMNYKSSNLEFSKVIGFYINNDLMFTFTTSTLGNKNSSYNKILDKYLVALDFFGGFSVSVNRKTTFNRTGFIAGVELTDEFDVTHVFELRYEV